jgi:signal transduction histidine kinase
MQRSRLFFALLSTTVMAQAPVQPTPEKAQTLVKAAITYAKTNGMDKLIEQTNEGDGRFHVGSGSQLYIFVYDFHGVCKAIGYDTQKLVGVNRWDLRDSTGKFFIREIVATAKDKGEGWVDYQYPNPQTGTVQTKTSYVVRFNDFLVGAGIYKN